MTISEDTMRAAASHTGVATAAMLAQQSLICAKLIVQDMPELGGPDTAKNLLAVSLIIATTMGGMK